MTFRSSGNILLDQSLLLQDSVVNGNAINDLQQSTSLSNTQPLKVHFCLKKNPTDASQSSNQFKLVKDFHGKNKHAMNIETPREVRFQGNGFALFGITPVIVMNRNRKLLINFFLINNITDFLWNRQRCAAWRSSTFEEFGSCGHVAEENLQSGCK